MKILTGSSRFKTSCKELVPIKSEVINADEVRTKQVIRFSEEGEKGKIRMAKLAEDLKKEGNIKLQILCPTNANFYLIDFIIWMIR